MPLLSVAIWTPIVFGIILLALGHERFAPLVKMIALIGSLVGFLVTIPLITGFQLGSLEMQFVEHVVWINRFNVNYHLGVDGPRAQCGQGGQGVGGDQP